MFKWFKKRQQTASEEDVHFFLLLCFGRDPEDTYEITRRMGMKPFGVFKALLTSPIFQHTILDPLALGQLPPWHAYNEDQKKRLSAGFDKFFGLRISPSDIGPTNSSLFLKAIDNPRFLRLLTSVLPDAYSPGWLKQKLENAAEKAPLPIEGAIEYISPSHIEGYAINHHDQESRLSLRFFINGSYVGSSPTALLRRDIQEKTGGAGYYGFEHPLTIPAHLAHMTSLIVHVFDAESGQLACPPQTFSPVQAHGSHYILRLAADIGLIRQSLETDQSALPDGKLMDTLQKIEKYLPDISRYSAIPLDHYDSFKTLFIPKHAPQVKDDAPTIMTVQTPTEALCAVTDIILVTPPGTTPRAEAETWFRAAAHENPAASLFFCDYEEEEAEGTSPTLNARFDPDLLLQTASYATAFAIRRDALEAISGLRQNMKTAIWYDLWLRILGASGSTAFHHIPQLLMTVTKHLPIKASDAAASLKSYFNSQVINAHVSAHSDTYGNSMEGAVSIAWPLDPEMPRLAIIIPTKDGLDLIQDCVTSLRETLAHPDHTEIIIVDNGSEKPETKEWLRDIDMMDGVRVIVDDSPFNWSRLNNAAAALTDAAYLLFLNNDTKALDHGWDTVLRGQLHRPDIGAIGARLLFEDGSIQYAGYIMNEGNIVLKEGYAQSPNIGGYKHRTQLTHATSAIIGAFLGCRREVFESAGGFDEDRFAVAYNDIDFSLSAANLGLRNIVCPAITFHHFESKSRGYDVQNTEKRRRVKAEKQAFLQKWGATATDDPWYSKSFHLSEPTHNLLKAPVGDFEISNG